MLRRAKAAAALGLALAACGGPQRGPGPTPDPNDAIVTLECPVEDAEVWVNGRYRADVRTFRGGMALSPGQEHRIVIRHDDYHDRYFVLELEPKERRTLEAHLAEVLP